MRGPFISAAPCTRRLTERSDTTLVEETSAVTLAKHAQCTMIVSEMIVGAMKKTRCVARLAEMYRCAVTMAHLYHHLNRLALS